MTDELEREARKYAKERAEKLPRLSKWAQECVDDLVMKDYKAGALAERRRVLGWIFERGHYADGDITINWEELKKQFPGGG